MVEETLVRAVWAMAMEVMTGTEAVLEEVARKEAVELEAVRAWVAGKPVEPRVTAVDSRPQPAGPRTLRTRGERPRLLK